MPTDLDCYRVKKSRYLIFWNEKINAVDRKAVLDTINNRPQNLFERFKTFIVITETNSQFKTSELVFMNESSNTTVVFYLKDYFDNQIFHDDSICGFAGVGWRTIVRTINAIFNNE